MNNEEKNKAVSESFDTIKKVIDLKVDEVFNDNEPEKDNFEVSKKIFDQLNDQEREQVAMLFLTSVMSKGAFEALGNMIDNMIMVRIINDQEKEDSNEG